MKSVLLFLLLFATTFSYSQSLKKKYLGTYSGTIPPFAVDAGGEVVTVKEAAVSFLLEETGKATQTIDGSAVSGSWQFIAAKDAYYEIGFTPVNSVVLQRYYLYKKGKKMERDGLYPQPDCILVKD